jgi:predicted GNAT family N-acyltransferase
MNYRVCLYNSLPEEAADIRNVVFVKEQGFTDEFDAIDERSWHVIVYDGEKAIATGRVFSDSETDYHIGRVAVLKEYRSCGIGRIVMKTLEQKAKELGAETIHLGAQCQAEEFYRKAGYKASGEVFLEQMCPHITMTKKL